MLNLKKKKKIINLIDTSNIKVYKIQNVYMINNINN